MSDFEQDYDNLLSLLVKAGIPAPLAHQYILAFRGQTEEAQRQFFEEARRDPESLRLAISQVADETIHSGAEYLFPALIVARHDDGTFDLELDLKGEFFRGLRKNFETTAAMLGLELKEGVRFYKVPGTEDNPIHKSHTTATIGFRDMDLGKPYAVPPMRILGGAPPDEEPTTRERGKVDVN